MPQENDKAECSGGSWAVSDLNLLSVLCFWGWGRDVCTHINVWFLFLQHRGDKVLL